MDEVWKAVPGYEKNYEVSKEGFVRSALSKRILKISLNSHGYPSVILYKNGKGTRKKIHPIVAACFIGPRPDNLTINHLDGNKLNNRVSNLHYCTHKENMQHASEMGLLRCGERCPQAKLTEDMVRMIRMFPHIPDRKFAKMFGVVRSVISDVKHYRIWKHVTPYDKETNGSSLSRKIYNRQRAS